MKRYSYVRFLERERWRRSAVIAALTVAFAATAIAAYAVTSAVRSGDVGDSLESDAVADQPNSIPNFPAQVPTEQRPDPATVPQLEPCRPEEFPEGSPGRVICAENETAKFEGTVAGIRLIHPLSPDGAEGPGCGGVNSERVGGDEFRVTSGTPFDIFADGLPPGVSDDPLTGPHAWVCPDGSIVTAGRLIVGDLGVIHIVKHLRGEPWASVDAPRARIEEIAVGGMPAVLVKPVVGEYDGRIHFARAHHDYFVVTSLIGYGATVHQLIETAEELLK